MHQIKIYISIILISLLTVSCIKEYYPEISSKDVNKYVVTGEVTDQGGIQKVTISKTSPINDPEFIGIPNCLATIFDDKGNSFIMEDKGNGTYEVYIDNTFITPGTSFKIDIQMPDGTRIVSDYDKVSLSPPLDSVYFERKTLPTPDPDILRHGIQYYVNLNGNEANSRYYRWEAVETWEYHADYPLIWYYDGLVHQVWPPDSSKMVCWRTDLVKSIYTLSTSGLQENKYQKLPLHFVDNKTSRLAYGYSVLFKQIALSEDAYVFWDKMRINSNGQSGLYEKQPLPVKGNLHNLTHPEEEVLGFFGAATVTTKRIFTGPVQGLVLDFSTMCSPMWLGVGGLKNIDPFEYPAALLGDDKGWSPYVMNPECVDCTKLGGVTVKPDFWPY